MLLAHFRERLVSVVLFGSAGRGEETPTSDVDLIVVIKDLPDGRYKRRFVLEPVFEDAENMGLTASFNCHIKTPDEAKRITVMYFDLSTDAKVLYDRGDFFKKIINRVKKIIRANGAVRKRWGKFYYWDVKPGAHGDEEFTIL